MILNGKATANVRLRDAVARLCEAGHRLQVRVTSEAGDAVRFGARITASLPEELKRRFGGSAYALLGFLSLLQRPTPMLRQPVS